MFFYTEDNSQKNVVYFNTCGTQNVLGKVFSTRQGNKRLNSADYYGNTASMSDAVFMVLGKYGVIR